MADGLRVILQKMLERLFASLLSGPGMNCRPHSSREHIANKKPHDALGVVRTDA